MRGRAAADQLEHEYPVAEGVDGRTELSAAYVVDRQVGLVEEVHFGLDWLNFISFSVFVSSGTG